MSKLLLNISLRVWHPTLPHDSISDRIGLPERFAHTAGDARTSPSGSPLGGVYEDTYVSMQMVRKKTVELGDEIESCYSIIEVHADFIKSIVDTGGKVEFYVSAFLKDLGGFELDSLLLKRLAGTGIGFAIELYPEAA
ncbi:hypothetical protein [Stenotrophomonas sp.]|uniref:hypothetical protein n=1 Tax=Stenotrophomonas sp. TaxID=69392 RepID=UPI0029A90815|nr:hypothetical protein [Stenotrophomonas sp.]MDX3934703.1 hypothetical protein [Stenotrophomonas sp.]